LQSFREAGLIEYWLQLETRSTYLINLRNPILRFHLLKTRETDFLYLKNLIPLFSVWGVLSLTCIFIFVLENRECIPKLILVAYFYLLKLRRYLTLMLRKVGG